MKSFIGENFLKSFFKTTKSLKKLDEVNNSEEILKRKKIAFEAWSVMVFMRGSYNRKYG